MLQSTRSLAPSPLGGGCSQGVAKVPPHVARTPARQRDLRRTSVTAQSSSAAGSPKQALPRGPNETVSAAAAACLRALEAGVKRQRVEMLLPLVGATAIDDW